MSNPSKLPEPQPRPESSHRTPREIAEDEAGPIGDGSKGHHKKLQADQGPIRKVNEPHKKQSSDRNGG